jgi:glycosyltransferase involved in cell wall biosynthesis
MYLSGVDVSGNAPRNRQSSMQLRSILQQGDMARITRLATASSPRKAAVKVTQPSRKIFALPEYNLYYSSSVEGDLGSLLGAPHYSYRFAESKFTTAFSTFGASIHKLFMPEFYNSVNALPERVQRAGLPHIHLIFRSAEQIRLLKFGWNISCFAWEFDVLKDYTDVDEHPFLNQKRMLSLCDEIWVPSSYSKAVLEKHGLSNIHFIPAPIAADPADQFSPEEALRRLGRLVVAPLHFSFLKSRAQNRAACEERSTTLGQYIKAHSKQNKSVSIYLTILNPEDFRKNLDPMLRAFHHYSQAHPDAILLVKVLTASSRFHLLDVLADVIPNKLDSGTVFESPNIAFFSDYLSNSDMGALFSLAKYYLCTAICEGQNLPLLEAMSHGVVPVTTANTAMADYIRAENAFIIPDRLEPNDCIHLAGTIARKPFSVRRCRAPDIYDALLRSSSATSARYRAMSMKAKQMVRDRYSSEAVWPQIVARIAEASKVFKRRSSIRGAAY